MNPADAAQVGTAFSLASPSFILFATIAVLAVAVARRSGQARSLIVAALNVGFLVLIGGSLHGFLLLIGVLHAAYITTWLIRARPDEPRLKALGLTVLIGLWTILFLNKNMDIFGSYSVFSWLNVNVVGMSYLAFRAISTLMDARDLDDLEYLTYMNYMLFFPTLLAGPIERYDRFSCDLRDPPDTDIDDTLDALQRIALGMVKKFVLADNLAPLGIFAFGGHPETITWPMLWFGVVFQLMLIYLDFSGYCDIVIGLARLMGFKCQENFDRPYFAANIQEFWNRWHMSLTFFVRDYVFTPACRFIFWRVPRKKQFPYVTLAYFCTMLVIALWHKLSWGFLLFGIMHGLGLTWIQIKRQFLDRATFTQSGILKALNKPPQPLAIGLTWLFFSVSTFVWFFPPDVTARLLARLFLVD